MHSAAHLRRFIGPALAATALMAIALARTAPGTEHHGQWGYRGWAFQALAYSDVVALHDDRGGGRHPLPYVEDRIQYPVLLGVAMWLPSLAAPSHRGYLVASWLLLLAGALACVWTLARSGSADVWAFAASPALVVYGLLNWDLLALAALGGALLAFDRQRDRLAGALVGVGACLKLFPLLALPLLFALALRRGRRPALELALSALAVILLVNLPFALAGGATRSNWLFFFAFNRDRPLESSVWELFGAHAQTAIAAVNTGAALASLATALALALVELRARRLELFPALALLTSVFFLVGKVFSPQYWLWILFVLALASAPARLTTALSLLALADFVVTFASFALTGESARWFTAAVYRPTVALRFAAIAGAAGWALWKIARHFLPPARGARV